MPKMTEFEEKGLIPEIEESLEKNKPTKFL